VIAVHKRIVPMGRWTVDGCGLGAGVANVASGRLGGGPTGRASKSGTHRGPVKCAPPSTPAATTTTAPSATHHASTRRDDISTDPASQLQIA
jgi:hypothetical protein